MTSSGAAGRFSRGLGALYLRLAGWRIEGRFPDAAKAVVIAAPHTSNWDLPLMLAIAYGLGIRPAWLGKRELFRWPIGRLMRALGGLPVDRAAPQNLVQQAAERFRTVDRLHLVIPPSGTRSRATHWKSGFYHIARGGRVPIVCAFLDYRRRVGGIGPVLIPSGNVTEDMARIRAFYADIVAKFPEAATPVRLREEEESVPPPASAYDAGLGTHCSGIVAL
jgi:1-acyl-sn-glycerol-3-phosphate acyltransferase